MEEKTQNEINLEVHTALFGDPERGLKGVVQMTTEMYEAWSLLIAFGKVIVWCAGVAAAVATAWMAFGGAVKKLINSI